MLHMPNPTTCAKHTTKSELNHSPAATSSCTHSPQYTAGDVGGRDESAQLQ